MRNIDELAEALEQGMGTTAPATIDEAMSVAETARRRVFHRYGDRITKTTELQATAIVIAHRVLREPDAKVIVELIVDAVEIAFRLGREWQEQHGAD